MAGAKKHCYCRSISFTNIKFYVFSRGYVLKNNKGFFLISFLPALAYWYLEENYDLKTALIGGVLLGVTEIILEKVFTKHVHTLSKVNFFLIVGLGGISLIASEGIWFKLQPFFNGLIMGGLFLFSSIRGKSYFYEIMEQTQKVIPPKELIIRMEKHLAIFMMSYGCFMALVAFKFTTKQWVFYKTIGLYIAFGIFMVFEVIILRKSVKHMYQQQMFEQVSNQMSVKGKKDNE
jgi:intracellular septation protein